MRPLTIISCLAILTAHQVAMADEGAIRICRRAGIVGSMDARSFKIPAGSSFTSRPRADGDDSRAITVATIKAVTIGPKPACVDAPARVLSNLSGHPIDATQGKLAAQFAIPGLELEASVTSLFH